MGDVIIFNDESIDFIWNTIQNQQIIFHPKIAPEGKIKCDIFAATKRRKTLTLFVDRNILSSLLKFCEIGSLKNKGESQLIGVIMAWAIFNDMPISAGMAIKERAFQLRSQEKGLVELQKFLEIFEVYPGQMWLQVAEGQLTEIPPIKYSNTLAQNISVNYADGGDHYNMAVASLLHAVWLYRDQTKRPIEKVREFIQWMYDYLLVSEYLLVYVIMLFTGQDNIKAPKHANSNDLGKIVAGCKNQAWDIAYLTNWSTLYSDTDKYSEEFLFATNDILLKRIFVNCNTPFGVNGLLFNVFHKKEYNQLMDYIEDRVRNRIKPDFGGKPQVYFQELIEEEKRKIQTLLKI